MEQLDFGRGKTAIYVKVAYDIASRIASGELAEGARFSGRSLMGSSYKVSQETIRRAMKLLADMGIIEIRQNSGAQVASREKALAYLEKSRIGRDIYTLKRELRLLTEQRSALDVRINKLISDILDLNDRFEKSNPLRNYEYRIGEGSPLCGLSISECGFRRNTGALIVALKHRDDILLSPEPDTVLNTGDVLVIAGSPLSALRAEALIKGESL